MGDCKVSDQVYNAFGEMETNLVTSISDAIGKEVLPPDFQDKISQLTDYAMTEEQWQESVNESDNYKWKRVHKPAMEKKSEAYTNLKEGVENINKVKNIEVIHSVRQAIESRHYTFKGSVNFNSECEKNANFASKIAADLEEEDIKKLNNYTSSSLNSYKSLYNYQESIGSIINSKLDELKKITNKIDTYKQNLYIDGRKDSYENSNYDFYKSIHFYILLLYYVLIICYFIFTPFFQDNKYKDYKLVTLIVFFIMLPLLLPYMLSFIYNAYEYILESNNLKGEIISYPYIIEDREKYE